MSFVISAAVSELKPGSRPATLQDHERQRCEVWTRVMGYHRPVSEFNPGKQGEHGERRHFVEQGGLRGTVGYEPCAADCAR
ncbi:MAG: anaerobic ribonucleoside-triphosphate reductase [Azospira sp.]|nr:anaerobic ribonucleoside-triphosphate reductase [Azospira sp.]